MLSLGVTWRKIGPHNSPVEWRWWRDNGSSCMSSYDILSCYDKLFSTVGERWKWRRRRRWRWRTDGRIHQRCGGQTTGRVFEVNTIAYTVLRCFPFYAHCFLIFHFSFFTSSTSLLFFILFHFTFYYLHFLSFRISSAAAARDLKIWSDPPHEKLILIGTLRSVLTLTCCGKVFRLIYFLF